MDHFDEIGFIWIHPYENFFLESDRVRDTIPFDVVRYGNTFTNETFDIYGIDLPEGRPFYLLLYIFMLVIISFFCRIWFSLNNLLRLFTLGLGTLVNAESDVLFCTLYETLTNK